MNRVSALLARSPVDPFILAILAAVGIAALLPARGVGSTVASDASTAAVGLLFFLYGARLSNKESLEGLKHWRLHVAVLLSTFAVFPLLGLAARVLVPTVLSPELYTGLLFLCLLPSTVQSSIAFTSMAKGNVAAAICAGSYSSLLGIVITPVLAGVLLTSSGASGFSAHSIVTILLEICAPFVAGQLLRRWIGGFVTRHKKVLGKVDRSSILIVVYTAFSEGMVEGIWHKISVPSLLALLVVEAALLAVVLLGTSLVSRKLGFGRGDRIAIVFCGSKKSLVNGLPMAAVLFGNADPGLVVLPLMLFHQMQLMVCAVLARRWGAAAGDDVSVPEGADGQEAVPAGARTSAGSGRA